MQTHEPIRLRTSPGRSRSVTCGTPLWLSESDRGAASFSRDVDELRFAEPFISISLVCAVDTEPFMSDIIEKQNGRSGRPSVSDEVEDEIGYVREENSRRRWHGARCLCAAGQRAVRAIQR